MRRAERASVPARSISLKMRGAPWHLGSLPWLAPLARPPNLAQREILRVLCRVAREQGTHELKYVSEWLGYLPFGQYHWVEVGKDHHVEQGFPDGWEERDLDRLEDAGLLELVDHEERDETDSITIYRVTAAGFEAVDESGPSASTRDRARERSPGPEPRRNPEVTRGDRAKAETTVGALPPCALIPGTVVTGNGEDPFVFEVATGALTRGLAWIDRTPTRPTRPQRASLAQAVRRVYGLDLDSVRVGQLRCRHCREWFDVLTRPAAWSYGMCLSCSMDLSSDTFGS